MGVYLNSPSAYTLYKNETEKPYFVDKSLMLKELFPLVREGNNHICITRPRRFGKTVIANMIASFFSRGCNSNDIFQSLNISKDPEYKRYQNQFPVIHISLNELPRKCSSYEEYIDRIEKRLIRDLQREYPDIPVDKEEAVWDVLTDIYTVDTTARFVFVLDEWDFIFHQSFITEADEKAYLSFLRNMLKDQPYVLFTYMTGILPIAKYSSGSELNMFIEFTMVTEERFSEDFGFTEKEVDMLYERYLLRNEDHRINREGLRDWYNGYHTFSGERVYNPRSVVWALENNNLGNYWSSSGPYDEIFYYVKHNISAVQKDLLLMISGGAVPVKIREYAATATELKSKSEIFSAMGVYGFLSYENGQVTIPNRELMGKFDDMIRTEDSLGYVYRLAKESERMLQVTLKGDTDIMEEILELVHDTEIPLLSYNNETELTSVVNLAYLAARDTYRVEREDKAGVGYVDFIFYPEINTSSDCMILELKMDSTPEDAIEQIKDKKYALRFKPKSGEKPRYTGRILAVGISYDRKSKVHHCKIEELK